MQGAYLTVGMVCMQRKDCRYDHIGFDSWSEEDTQMQIKFVKSNAQKLAFNADPVKTLRQAFAGLTRAPTDSLQKRRVLPTPFPPVQASPSSQETLIGSGRIIPYIDFLHSQRRLYEPW